MLSEKIIEQFAKARRDKDTQYTENYIEKSSMLWELRAIFEPIFNIPEAFKTLIICIGFFVGLPILVIGNMVVFRRNIKLLFLLFKHRKAIKAYKKAKEKEGEGSGEDFCW